ncbi:MAG: sulfite exporter TauE/SafE family protein [Acidimicrobiales bacterium]
MNIAELSLVLLGISVLAGVLGSLLGLGGGFVIVPVLTLVFHLDIRLAIGTSIVAVAATSSAGAARNVSESITNLRVATFLAMATTLGAVTGALLSGVVDARFLFGLFGLILAVSGVQMLRKRPGRPAKEPGSASGGAMRAPLHPVTAAGVTVPGGPAGVSRNVVATGGDGGGDLADRLALHSAYYDKAEGSEVPYVVTHTGLGLALMYTAGTVSGLLGIGSGVLKVPAMDLAMHIPMKVSTATSNLLIGLTAAASAAVYFARGDIDPLIAGPVSIGVLLGATQGSKLLVGMRSDRLRVLFVIVLLLVAAQMLWKGIG